MVIPCPLGFILLTHKHINYIKLSYISWSFIEHSKIYYDFIDNVAMRLQIKKCNEIGLLLSFLFFNKKEWEWTFTNSRSFSAKKFGSVAWIYATAYIYTSVKNSSRISSSNKKCDSRFYLSYCLLYLAPCAMHKLELSIEHYFELVCF